MATAIAPQRRDRQEQRLRARRVSGYVAHWDHPNSDGWTTHLVLRRRERLGFAYGDITVPAGTQRLVVVLTWDEPPASAGASRAVTYDLDLWVDHDMDCGDPIGACGEYSRSPASTTSSTSSSTTLRPAPTG